MMTKPYIFITRKLTPAIVEPLMAKFEVNMWDSEATPVPRETLLSEAAKANAIITMLSDRIDQEVFSVASNLQVVANLAVGYDNIDIQAARASNVIVCNTPEVLTDTTADLGFALLMATARQIPQSMEAVKKGEWTSWSPLYFAGADIHHKTIGVVGMGKIGETVAKRATGFDMEILYHNRSRKPDAEKALGAKYCSFDELVEKSDFIVCLTPLTPDTKLLFTAEVFGKMKPTAIFINLSRGMVVDEVALYEALKNKTIAAAGLDVFQVEPIGKDHPLLTLDNVVTLPHIGSSSVETRTAMMELCVENVDLVLSGKPPKTEVK